MKALGYYLTLPILYFISYLPFKILYLLSDFIFLIVYHLVGYRKKVVRLNLSRSFPEKSAAELLKIEKQFYGYIVDFFLEVIKCITMSETELRKRISFENYDLLNHYKALNKSFIVTTGHYGNHEILNLGLPFILPFRHKAVYRPLNNSYFDRFFYKFRTRYGAILVSMADASKEIAKIEDFTYAFFLVNDQSPPPDRSYWTTFLNQETGFFTGHERFARQYDMPVVYMCANRTARGYYQVKVELITDTPNALPEGELLERHARKLERDILADPSIWFWSHKRWKFTRIGGEIIPNIYKK